MESGAGGQIEKIEAGRGDVLTHVAGMEVKGGDGGIGEELGVEEMDLGEVGASGVFSDVVEVLDGLPEVGVALDAEAGEEVNGGLRVLGEAVGLGERDGEDGWGHGVGVPGVEGWFGRWIRLGDGDRWIGEGDVTTSRRVTKARGLDVDAGR